jgi:hypothetical protein
MYTPFERALLRASDEAPKAGPELPFVAVVTRGRTDFEHRRHARLERRGNETKSESDVSFLAIVRVESDDYNERIGVPRSCLLRPPIDIMGTTSASQLERFNLSIRRACIAGGTDPSPQSVRAWAHRYPHAVALTHRVYIGTPAARPALTTTVALACKTTIRVASPEQHQLMVKAPASVPNASFAARGCAGD